MNSIQSEASIQFIQKKVTLALLAITLILFLGNGVGMVFKWGFDHHAVFGLVQLFDLNKESNIPTYFASMLHLFSAILLALISLSAKKTGDKQWIKWCVMSLVFLFTSIDESAGLHELTIRPLQNHFGASGLLFFAWVIPAFFIMSALALYFMKFLLQLPKKTKILFFLSAFIFVGGAMGVELPEGLWYEKYGKQNLVFNIFTTVRRDNGNARRNTIYSRTSWVFGGIRP